MMGRKLALATTALAALFVGVEAQVTTNATCLSSYSWMTNSRGQSPCLVSGYLSAQCNSGQWNVPAITPDGPQYLPPHDAGANLCRCNTVTYSLLQACSTCQGGTIGTWTDWIFQCQPTNVYVQQYPLSIPASVNIPAWAYLNVVPTNKFDPTLANSYANAPESTGGGSPTATTTTGPRVPTGTGLPNPTPPKKSGGGTNIGAIVGGVVGGILGLALIGGLIAFILRQQKRKNKAASNAFANGGGDAVPQFSQVPQSPVTAYPTTPGTPGIKPYDPNDPSTFPVTPAPNYALPYNNTQQLYPQQPAPTGTNSYYGGNPNDEFNRPPTIYSGNPQFPAPQGPPPHGGYTGAAEL